MIRKESLFYQQAYTQLLKPRLFPKNSNKPFRYLIIWIFHRRSSLK